MDNVVIKSLCTHLQEEGYAVQLRWIPGSGMTIIVKGWRHVYHISNATPLDRTLVMTRYGLDAVAFKSDNHLIDLEGPDAIETVTNILSDCGKTRWSKFWLGLSTRCGDWLDGIQAEPANTTLGRFWQWSVHWLFMRNWPWLR